MSARGDPKRPPGGSRRFSFSAFWPVRDRYTFRAVLPGGSGSLRSRSTPVDNAEGQTYSQAVPNFETPVTRASRLVSRPWCN